MFSECNEICVLLESKTIFTDIRRKQLLTNTLIPHENDPLPYSKYIKKGNIVKYYLRFYHLQRISSILYSLLKKGIISKFWSIFSINKQVRFYYRTAKPVI